MQYAMIPKHMRSRARATALFAVGLVIIGSTLGAIWVLMYMPK